MRSDDMEIIANNAERWCPTYPQCCGLCGPCKEAALVRAADAVVKAAEQFFALSYDNGQHERALSDALAAFHKIERGE